MIPKWFKPVTIGALIWNLFGIMAFFMIILMTPEMLAELPAAESEFYRNRQIWATIAFGIAVFGSTIGCILLLIKKALAFEVFVVAFIAILTQMFHDFILLDSLTVFGPSALILPSLIVIIAIDLIFISHKAKQKGWIE